MSTKPTIAAISVPFDLGAGRRGASKGPKAIFQAGLLRGLQQMNMTIQQVPEIRLPNDTAAPLPPEVDKKNLKYLAEVIDINTRLAEQVSKAAEQGQFPLVIGGDHSIAIGTLAGLSGHYTNLGVIWIDAHSDLNTADTSPSGNIHGMSLAISLGMGHPLLTGIKGAQAKVKPENIVLIGSRSLDEGEKKLIRSLGIRCYTMHDIDRKGMATVMQDAIAYISGKTDGVHVSFDVDSLDPLEAPGTGTAVKGGLQFREAHLAVEMLHEAGIVTSAEFVEVNPLLDDNNKTSHLAVGLISSLLGKQIL
ncbi:arginase [Paenibacillus sp. CGMCC 1.16610]|uniref:Arginase n=1 Tax=Paenibacillus anseongense TaxID=2682845 RepID=A0ABW9UF31_9BACL|nr:MULTISPECIES: arginase [Paenibacillus]MBA2943991.1 arginase [Paenibacillus sp. CGMCC 1.16610]MVQ37880.1 arginase [Paenibacillus anseongense]